MQEIKNSNNYFPNNSSVSKQTEELILPHTKVAITLFYLISVTGVKFV